MNSEAELELLCSSIKMSKKQNDGNVRHVRRSQATLPQISAQDLKENTFFLLQKTLSINLVFLPVIRDIVTAF